MKNKLAVGIFLLVLALFIGFNTGFFPNGTAEGFGYVLPFYLVLIVGIIFTIKGIKQNKQ